MKTRFFIITFCLLSVIASAQRISVSGTEFRANGSRIWINGTNTPWHNWNEFSNGIDQTWWENEFQRLKDNHINCTRVWLQCSGANSGVIIDDNGLITGLSDKFFTDVDKLMNIAREKQIYLMVALISFDHTEAENPNVDKWVKMYTNEANRQSFADNYAKVLVTRYNDNPYFFAVDVANEIDWTWDNQGIASSNAKDLMKKVSNAIHDNSNVLVCQGMGAGPKYNTSANGCSGNYLSDCNMDFYNIHYYDWENQWFSNPFDKTPSYYAINSKPCIIGECPSKGSANYTSQKCSQRAYEKGWQGIMPWTSNGVDDNGSLDDSKEGSDWIYANYPQLVYPPVSTSVNSLTNQGNGEIDIKRLSDHLLQVNIENRKERNSSMFIYTLSGKLILKRNLSQGSNEVPLEGIHRGIYLLKVAGEKCVQSKKIVISSN